MLTFHRVLPTHENGSPEVYSGVFCVNWYSLQLALRTNGTLLPCFLNCFPLSVSQSVSLVLNVISNVQLFLGCMHT